MTLPQLHLADWRPTKDTLHLYAQIVGKIRLATTAPRNHWWNAPLYVDVRGLTTRRVHRGDTTFEIRIDFVDHALIVQTADGRTTTLELGSGLPVADFDARLHEAVRCPDDDAVSTRRRARLVGSRRGRTLRPHPRLVGQRVRGVQRLVQGKTSPVHLFWHGLDLAVTRFSGRPGGPLEADPVTQEAYSHEVISFGFWAGDDTVGDATFYSYTAPEPEGLREQPLSAGSWIEYGSGSLAVLPYEGVRSARDPRTTLLAFCQSAYEAGARLAGWDTTSFESKWCPTPGQLNQLHAAATAEFGRPSAST
jgi:Family of unknown function (DUF5996)